MTSITLGGPGFNFIFFHGLMAFLTLVVHCLLECRGFFYFSVAGRTFSRCCIPLSLVVANVAPILEIFILVLFNLFLMLTVGEANRGHLLLYFLDDDLFRANVLFHCKGNNCDKCEEYCE